MLESWTDLRGHEATILNGGIEFPGCVASVQELGEWVEIGITHKIARSQKLFRVPSNLRPLGDGRDGIILPVPGLGLVTIS